MSEHNEILLSRDTEAIQIPAGLKTTIPADTRVVITQNLGGSYTIACDYGLFRISESDADALGLERKASSEKSEHPAGEVAEEAVWDQLRTVYDPEIPVNIVDLGLIYGVKFDPAPDDKQDVSVEMTLTAQGCPEHVNISMQVKSRLEQLPGIRNAAVNVVWSPPWTPERLSPDARKQLGIE